MQSNIVVDNTAKTISGTAKHLTEPSELVNYWGAGHFLALSFEIPAADAAAGVTYSGITVAGSQLDEELRGAWMIGRDSDGKKATKITIVTTNGTDTLTQDYTLNITFEE